jgi:hypothetical protein
LCRFAELFALEGADLGNIPIDDKLAQCHIPYSNTHPKDRKAYLRTLLYPARFCYSWMTGCMGSNDDAVAFLGKTRPAPLDVSLISRALQCRHADADPDFLFPARRRLPSQIDACAALLTGVSWLLLIRNPSPT